MMCKQRWIFSLILLMIAGLASCNKASLNSEASKNTLSDENYYLSAASEVRIYWLDTDLGTYITQLLPTKGKLILPKSLLVGDYGSREKNSEPVTLDLIAKVYYPNHPSGDFYFESPVLGTDLVVSNVTTALSWFLKYSYYNQKIKISKKSFDELILSIEVKCIDCRKKTNSEVLNLIRNDNSTVDMIREILVKENTDLNFNVAALQPGSWTEPKPIWAWSTPILSIHGTSSKDSDENKSIKLSCFYVDPLNSIIKINPTTWSHTFNSVTNLIDTSNNDIDYLFSYEESGSHVFKPLFSLPVVQENISVTFSVNDTNRSPRCDTPLVIHARANVFNSVPLSPYCKDPDVDETGLAYTLSNGPNGLVVTNTGLVNWTPSSSLTSSVVYFSVSDSKLAVSNESAKIIVDPDNPPIFTSIQTDYNFVEGTESTFTVTAKDADGDPLELTIEAVDQIKTGFPDGAGSLAAITKTLLNGEYTFTVKFKPSYLQMIGSSGSSKVKFFIHYESQGGNFDSSIRFDERVVNFNITNVDDPPQWDIQPTDFNAIEAINFSGLNIGHATDPALNQTAITYSIVFLGDEHCRWAGMTFTKDVSDNALLWGAPPYNASSECSFYFKATDANGLVGESDTIKITTDNTNQPITLLASPTTVVNGVEGKLMSINLDEMFLEPDLTTDPIDTREILTYDCLTDTDTNGTYESACTAVGLNISFSSNSLTASWTPPALSAGTYKIRLTITDVGGATATNDFDLVIAEAATPMNLSAWYLGSASTDITVAEATTVPLVLKAEAASGRAIDIYDFIVSAPTCNVIGGSGACSASLIVSPGTLAGTGTTDLTFTLNPNYTDSNTSFPATTRRYAVSFYLQKSDDPTVYTQHSINITVSNTNRSPTAINVTKGSFGCTGSTANSDTTAFTVCVDASQDKKVGNSWSKTYSVPVLPIDADGNNDSYSFAFQDTLVPGSITDGTWNFKLPSCMNSASTTMTRTYDLQLSDGRGGTVVRQIILKVVKGSASLSCM
ncbi:MAG: Ig domain-containing protein [Bdellovibrionaceae bacterium]|nr:Ig domain-containing protein [Pseudobdellovibrionaceae bacterium]